MNNCKPFLLAIAVLFIVSTKLSAQNVINAGVVTTQNFNSMGSSSTASLPVGWRVSIAGGGSTATYSNSPITAVTQAASSGTPTTGGVYNWGTTGGTDRSLGFLEDGYGATNAIVAQYTNNTGNPVTVITISYQAENYVESATVASVGLSWSTDDIVYTPAGTNASFASVGSTVYSFSPGRTVTRTVTIFGVNILNGQNVYFRWIVDANTPNSEGIGLDDVAVSSESTTIAATLTSTITTDAPPTGKPNPGDVIAYTATITTTGSAVARNLQINEPAPNNTTLVPGSVKTSALANDDNYTTPINTPLTGTTVLANDYGLPTVSLVSYGSSAGTEGNFTPTQTSATAQGGTVVMNADGTFTYTPPSSSFVGYDQFYYVATTGTLPNNDAIVTIAVGVPATANSDNYPNAIGNMTVTDNVLTNDQGSGTLTVTKVNNLAGNVGNPTPTANNGSVTVNSNGTFSYIPPAGFTGTDQFSYTINNSFNLPSTATVNITLSNRIWFVNNAVASSGDGTQASPFKQTSNVTGTLINDNIFFYESSNPYTGSITLLNGQKLIGQDASNNLATITGLTFPSYNTPPSMNPGSGTVSLTASNANIVTLANGNLIRGLTLSSAGTGYKLTGNNFGTLTIGNNTSADVLMNGNGGTMSLTTGTFGSTSGLTSVQSSGSAAQGLILQGVASGGTINFGSTSISGSIAQGILIETTTANITLGNTSVTGGTDGVSLQNNSSGTKTFGILNVSGGSGNAFLHAGGGGNVSVTGATTLSSAGDPVDASNVASGTSINFQSSVSATRTASGGEGIHWSGTNTNATLTFNSLTVQTNAGTGLNLSGGGTVNVTSNTGTINNTSQAAPAIVANGVALNANFASINSSGGTNGVSLTNVTGTSNFGSGALSGASGATFLINGQNGTFSYGGTIGQTNAQRAVDIQNMTASGSVTLSGAITASTSTANAVYLNSNTNATITFSGNNNSLTTTSGIGFNATAGGTVNVTGTGNAISSGTGTALNIANTTIGSSNVTFKSISANGGTNGIVLNTTGLSGGLVVSGDGGSTSNNSGGTINGSTGTGIFLNTTANVSLGYMNVQNGSNDGIKGLNVTNFTLNHCNVTSNGNSTVYDGIKFGEISGNFVGVTGTVSITNSNISSNAAQNIHLRNTSGTISSFTVTGSSFNNLNTTYGANSFLLEMSGTATLTTGTLSGCTFQNNNPEHGLTVQAHDNGVIGNVSSSGVFIVSGNTFINNGVQADFDQDAAGNMNFQFINNGTAGTPMTGAILQAVNVFSSSQSTGGTLRGRVQGNFIGTSTALSASTQGGGLRVLIQGHTTATIVVDNNTIKGYDSDHRGIDVEDPGPVNTNPPVVTSDFTITNNTVTPGTSTSGFPTAAIFVGADNQSGSDATAQTMRADIHGNTVPAATVTGDFLSGQLQYYLFTGTNANGKAQLVGSAGTAAAQLAATNTGSTSASAGITIIAGPISTAYQKIFGGINERMLASLNNSPKKIMLTNLPR